MIYYVDDIRNFGSGSNVKTIEANTPLEAVKKVYPNYKVSRDYSGEMGDIVVGRYTKQWYGKGYRTYVYIIEKQ